MIVIQISGQRVACGGDIFDLLFQVPVFEGGVDLLIALSSFVSLGPF